MSDKPIVYVVLQTQPAEDYFTKVIRIFNTPEKAELCTRNLNKSYGYGCKFNEHGDYEETLSDEDCHYYEWEVRRMDNEVDEVEEDPNYPYVLECWTICSNGYSYTYESTNEYVSATGGKTKSIDKAKKFIKWEDAWKFAHTLEGIGAFKGITLSISSK